MKNPVYLLFQKLREVNRDLTTFTIKYCFLIVIIFARIEFVYNNLLWRFYLKT